MAVYVDIVVLLNFCVDLLLLLGTNRLCGYPMRMGKAIVAALFGGLYGGICVLPGFYFLGNAVWRAVSLVLMSAIAFGFDFSAARRGIVFFILSMCQNIRIFADYLKRKYDEEIFMFDILYRHGGVPCTK